MNFDVTHIDGVRMVNDEGLDYAPDVMILPSRLKQFSKVGSLICPWSTIVDFSLSLGLQVVHSTTIVNPSFLSKGTYGTISIAARSAGTPKERVTAEVMKIELRAATTSTSTTTLP